LPSQKWEGTVLGIDARGGTMTILRIVLATFLAAGIAGGASAQTITCPTGVTQSGGSGPDTLTGTAGPDRITGQGGNDTISGNDGSDCLNGGSNDDTLDGGRHDDYLAGEGGVDRLSGGEGDDKLDGGTGNDVVLGDFGDDNLTGQGGNDRFYGSRGADKISGGRQDDHVYILPGDVPAGRNETVKGGDDFDTVWFVGFDPGPVVTPDFTVTDPVTGGTYTFTGIEQVIVF
jgi:Ca2+-binding RTX toxin-like protein